MVFTLNGNSEFCQYQKQGSIVLARRYRAIGRKHSTCRGIAYSAKGDYDQAIADYNQAIRLNPNYGMAYYNRGSAYADKRDYDRAIADFEVALRINPNDANARTNLEAARRERGR